MPCPFNQFWPVQIDLDRSNLFGKCENSVLKRNFWSIKKQLGPEQFEPILEVQSKSQLGNSNLFAELLR